LKKQSLILAAGLVLATTACTPQSFYLDTKGTAHPVQIHAEHELRTDHAPWNIAPPERLDIIMEVDVTGSEWMIEAATNRCNDYGGTMVWYEDSDQHVCQGVDY
jgi:hypothetical protein